MTDNDTYDAGVLGCLETLGDFANNLHERLKALEERQQQIDNFEAKHPEFGPRLVLRVSALEKHLQLVNESVAKIQERQRLAANKLSQLQERVSELEHRQKGQDATNQYGARELEQVQRDLIALRQDLETLDRRAHDAFRSLA